MLSEGESENKQFTDKQLDILNDHYKDTFTRLRETEQARDRLFLWLIGLFVLLILEIGYPAAVGGTLGKIKIADAEISLQALPLAALLNVTWLVTLLVDLQYCQATVRVNRQYPYLRMLEETVSPSLGGGEIYQREGAVYLKDYPLLLDVAWFTYIVVFPLVIMGATIWLISSEITGLRYPLANQLFDIFVGAIIATILFVYRIQPAIAAKFRRSDDRPLSSEPYPAPDSMDSADA